MKWYRKSAEQGYSTAQSNLGFLYRKGKGVAQNDKEAVKWYRKAAEQGNVYALKILKERVYEQALQVSLLGLF